MSDQYNKNRVSSLSFSNVDPMIFDQYTYINIEGGEGIEYLKGKYVVRSKAEVYTSSDDNFTIFSNELTIAVENTVE